MEFPRAWVRLAASAGGNAPPPVWVFSRAGRGFSARSPLPSTLGFQHRSSSSKAQALWKQTKAELAHLLRFCQVPAWGGGVEEGSASGGGVPPPTGSPPPGAPWKVNFHWRTFPLVCRPPLENAQTRLKCPRYSSSPPEIPRRCWAALLS